MDFYELKDKPVDELIDLYGKTRGVSIYLTVNAVQILEDHQWEDVERFIYAELCGWIDE